MALAAPQQDLISKVGQACKVLLDVQADVQIIDVLYNGSPNWDVLFTDGEIAAVGSFAAVGLTAADVADAIYQLNLIRTQIQTGNLPAMVKLSQVG